MKEALRRIKADRAEALRGSRGRPFAPFADGASPLAPFDPFPVKPRLRLPRLSPSRTMNVHVPFLLYRFCCKMGHVEGGERCESD
jgi:hypothetical protein